MGPSLIAQPLSPRAFGPSFAPVGPRLSLAGYPVWVVCPTGQDSATAMPIGLLSCLPPSARTLSGPLDGGRDRHGVGRGSAHHPFLSRQKSHRWDVCEQVLRSTPK